MSTNILLKLNKCFKPVKHPFNMEQNGESDYGTWEYERGEDTVGMYLKSNCCDEKSMFEDKLVLDIGAGQAGKSLYYLSLGAKRVIALDVVEEYKSKAIDYAKRLGLEDKFEYCVANAAELPFDDNSFDIIIMNDAMEHVSPPNQVVSEMKRVLKVGGRAYINFPPYGHPYGAHLSDVISIPWVHLFFSEKTLIDSYKLLVEEYSDGDNRIDFRISKDNDGNEYFSYINKMTIKKFKGILSESGMKKLYYKELPLRSFLKPVATMPYLKEWFVKMVVCILEKSA